MSAFEEANDKKSKTSSKFYDVSRIEKHAFEKAFERLWAKAESASLYTVPGTNGYTLHVQGIKSVKITFDHIDVTRMIVLQSKHRKNTKLLFLMTSVMMACLRLQTENASDGTAKAQEYCKSILATFVQTTLEETGVVYFRDEAMLCLSGCITAMNEFYKSASWEKVAREVHKVLCIIEKGPHGNVVAMVTAVTKHPNFHRFKNDKKTPQCDIVICDAIQEKLAHIPASSLPDVVNALIAVFKKVRHVKEYCEAGMSGLVPILGHILQPDSFLSGNDQIVSVLRDMQVVQELVVGRWDHYNGNADTLVHVKRMGCGDMRKLEKRELPVTVLPFEFCTQSSADVRKYGASPNAPSGKAQATVDSSSTAPQSPARIPDKHEDKSPRATLMPELKKIVAAYHDNLLKLCAKHANDSPAPIGMKFLKLQCKDTEKTMACASQLAGVVKTSAATTAIDSLSHRKIPKTPKPVCSVLGDASARKTVVTPLSHIKIPRVNRQAREVGGGGSVLITAGDPLSARTIVKPPKRAGEMLDEAEAMLGRIQEVRTQLRVVKRKIAQFGT